MFENLIVLIVGSLIGFLTSIVTTWIQHRLEMKRQRERWNYGKQEKKIEDARQFMRNRDSYLLRYGSTEKILFGKILVESGPNQGTTILIKKNTFVIGQSKEICDLIVCGSDVADAHLRLMIVDDIYVLEDISGRIGTHLDDELMTKPIIIKDGNLIKVGKSSLRFQKA